MITFLLNKSKIKIFVVLIVLCSAFAKTSLAENPPVTNVSSTKDLPTNKPSTFIPAESKAIVPANSSHNSAHNSAAINITLVTDHWQPFYGPDLNKGGYIIEICKAAFAATGYQLKIKFMPWKRATKAVSRGIYDGLLGAYYTAERAKYLYYSQALAKEKTSLIALKSRALSYQKKADLEGYTIGVMRAAVNDSELDNNLQLDFSYANDASHNLQKLIAKRVDFMITGEAHLAYLVKHNRSGQRKIEMSDLEVFHPPIKVNPIYITIRKERKDSAKLITAFNRGIAIIKNNGQYSQIKNKHLSSLYMLNKTYPLLDFFQRINIVAR